VLFENEESASGFSDLLKGYCVFRLQDDIAANHAEQVTFSSSYSIGNIGIFSLRPMSVQLVGEQFSRVKFEWAKSSKSVTEDADLKAEFGNLEKTVNTILVAASNGKILSNRAHQSLDQILALMKGQSNAHERLASALESLSVALNCAFPHINDADDQSPTAVLESVRNHTFIFGVVVAAFASSLRNLGKDSSEIDALIDALLVVLEEAVKRSVSIEVHVKLVNTILVLSPQFAAMIKQYRKEVSDEEVIKDNVNLQALKTCLIYSRDSLSDLLTVCAPVQEMLMGGSPCDNVVRILWNCESVLRSLTGISSVTDIMNALKLCNQLVEEKEFDQISSQVNVLFQSVTQLTVRSKAAPVKGRRGMTVVQLMCELFAVLVSFTSDMHSQSVFAEGRESFSVVVQKKAAQALVVKITQELLKESLWQQGRTCVRQMEAAMASLSVEESPDNVKENFEALWKEQTVEISNDLKAFKSSVRGKSFDGVAMSSLSEHFIGVVEKIRNLIQPFFVVDSSAVYKASASNIIRSMDVLSGDLQALFDVVASAEWKDKPSFDEHVSQVLQSIDSCITSLNFNNPKVAQVRQSDWLITAQKTGGWSRRGEISQQGAELKLKLTKKKALKGAGPDSPLRVSGRVVPPVKAKRLSQEEWNDDNE
jgi:hypothetical protein